MYLTGNPQITFFKVIYRRHTNYSSDSIEQTFNGEAGFNRKVTCNISRNGDLVHKMYLRVQLPSVTLPPKNGNTVVGFRWLDWIGHVLIKTVDFEIGGQKIDKHYGEWLSIWNELTQTSGHAAGYADMVGNTPDLTDLKMNTSTVSSLTIPGKELWIPMQFWFNRNPGLALPLVALQYHDIKVNYEFRDANECFWAGTTTDDGLTWTYAPNACRPSNFTASMFVDYIFLDSEERKRFAQSSHEYLIEQLQFSGDESIPANTTAWRSKLSFNHPCKQLVWVIQRDEFVSSVVDESDTLLRPGKQWFNWTTIADGEKVAIGNGLFAPKYSFPQGTNTMVQSRLQLNGHDRFTERGSRYFNLVQPYQHHMNTPSTGIYVYSFALKPEEHQPSGTCNMSRIDNATLTFTVQPNLGACRIKILAVNYNVLRVMSGMGGLAYSN